METMRYPRQLPALFMLLIGCNSSVRASDEADLSLVYGDEETVSIATGAAVPISRAPAVATVITWDQIKETGATDLDQVLETVPGLHVSRFYQGYNPIYTMRGIYSDINPQILMLVNGIPITNLYQGNRGQIWGGMPVNGISRIEVIRGPGSAVYGADAYAGVINVVTKGPHEIPHSEVGARAGSFDSKDYWLLYNKNLGEVETALSIEYGTTDGQRRIIGSDFQSALDATFGTSASLAPGPVNLGRRYLEMRLDNSWKDWEFRVGYQGRYNVQTGGGVSQALDPEGDNKSGRLSLDLSYHTNADHWDTTAQISYFDTSAQSQLVLFPPGAFGGTFPNGVIGFPSVFERHSRLGLSTFYTGFEKHRVRLGAGVNYGDLYKVEEQKNFTILPGGIVAPLGSLVDVTDISAFVQEKTRTDAYIFAQDEWSFINDWALTAGLRYDNYSDFGSTFNPRAALVWQTAYNLTSKLLYGRAFRAPSFVELYAINNPVGLGNPNLKPETIDTIELAFDYQPVDKIRTGLNVFHYHMNDIIRTVPDPPPATTVTAQNTGGQTGYGLEAEVTWSIMTDLSLDANYSLQHTQDEITHTASGNSPHYKVYGRLNWKISDWLISPQVTKIGVRQRAAGDTRAPLEGYTLVDVTLRRQHIQKDFEVAASIHNLFNADAREPSPAPGLIPGDLPLAGRSFYLEFRYIN